MGLIAGLLAAVFSAYYKRYTLYLTVKQHIFYRALEYTLKTVIFKWPSVESKLFKKILIVKCWFMELLAI